MAVPKSIILITVDCLRADHCGFMGYPRPTTPFLDGLARESFAFPAAIVAGVPTYYSFPAILASRYPLALGRDLLGLAVEERNLASTCKDNGYATAFFGAGNPYLSARFGYDFGFDTFRDFLDDDLTPLSNPARGVTKTGWAGKVNGTLASLSHKIPGIGTAYDELYFQYQHWAAPPAKSLDMLRRFPAADVIVDQARTWLASIGENPFLLWLHFMDPHSPYYPTEKGLELFGANRLTASRARYLNGFWNRFDIGSQRLRRHREEVIEMYDAGIRWVDAQIARLVEALRRFKLWENCVLAFTADHGEEFLEHGRRYHAPSLVEELIHVPLVVRVPGMKKQLMPGGAFSLLHLAPTLLDAAGLSVPAEFQGQSHWKHLREGTAWGEPAISECIAGCTNPFSPEQRRGARLIAVREARYKLTLNFATQTDCLFDLDADPQEHAPLPSSTGKQERRRLLEFALAHLRKSASRQSSPAYLRTQLREMRPNLTAAARATSQRAVG